jgi:hypothetical protein
MCSGDAKYRISREYKDLFVSEIAAQKSRGDLVSDTNTLFLIYTRGTRNVLLNDD